jgi:nitroimidazol reductase NimA-like FMN-containing flavoprotein (pyridoxamine 5'-phosphate oxidase superfamily)
MLIQEMTRGDSLSLLKSMRLGRLACAKDAQPYITPFYFSFAGNYLYSFSTVGQRIDWMRENPLVCVETDEVMSSQEWVSIIIFGRYQELTDTAEWERERAVAHELLQHHPDWWEPGYVKTTIDGRERPLDPVYFRIEITETTGHRATANGGGDQLG